MKMILRPLGICVINSSRCSRAGDGQMFTVFTSFKRLSQVLGGSFPGGSVIKSSCKAGDSDSIPGLEDPLEEEMATHSGILAWEIP